MRIFFLLLPLFLTGCMANVYESSFSLIPRKRIHLQPVDTTQRIIYDTEVADLYFSLSDVLQECKDSIFCKEFKKQILTSGTKLETKELQKNDIISFGMYDISFSLLKKGKCKIYVKVTKQWSQKTIIAKKLRGVLGGESVMFYLPKHKQDFYSSVISFGE